MEAGVGLEPGRGWAADDRDINTINLQSGFCMNKYNGVENSVVLTAKFV
jgi:hypothetical protein